MLLVGLTGGIGSGKSTVATILVSHGASLIDADVIAREVVAKGQPALAQLVKHFGQQIVNESGELDRPTLAQMVFNDPEALAALNAVTHPAIGVEMLRQINAISETSSPGDSRVTVVDIPLLKPPLAEALGLEKVIVVDCPVDVAVARLVELREMSETDARARVSSQVDRKERVAIADYVIDNSDGLENLRLETETLWGMLEAEAALISRA